jgi:denticleless
MNYGGKSNTYNGFTSLLICPSGIKMYASCVDKKIYAYNLSSYNPNPSKLNKIIVSIQT